MERIWLSSPHMGEKEKEYVAEAFSTNWIAPLGPHVDAFEKSLAGRLGLNSVAALNSGTAALHLALEVLDIQKEDEVICQGFTFAASAFPVLYKAAKPVFVDSEETTWNIDPELLRHAIKDRISSGKKPAAIIAVHLYGMPAQMEEIMAVADEFEIPVIEDAAEALGSSLHGKPCGSFGKLSILSFNGNKIITTSGGGAVCGNDAEMIERVRFLSTQSRENVPYYLHKETGYNYRLSNILAGIGRGQLEVLNKRVEQRRSNFDYYHSKLGSLEGISFLHEPVGFFSNRWLTAVVFDEKVYGKGMNEKMRTFLEKFNIESRPLWKPLQQQPVFEGCLYFGNGVSDRLFENGLCLPSGSNLTSEKLDRVIDQFKTALNEIS